MALLPLLCLGACVVTADYQALQDEQEDNYGFSMFALRATTWGSYISARGSLDTPLVESGGPGAGDTLVKTEVSPDVLNFGATYPLAVDDYDPAAGPKQRPGWSLHGMFGLGWARRTVFEKYATPGNETYWVEAANPKDELNFNFGLVGYVGHVALTASYDTVHEAVALGVGFAF